MIKAHTWFPKSISKNFSLLTVNCNGSEHTIIILQEIEVFSISHFSNATQLQYRAQVQEPAQGTGAGAPRSLQSIHAQPQELSK